MKIVSDAPIVKRPPLVVEIAGPAGAGKTTLLRALSQRNDNIVAGVPLSRITYLPFFVSNTTFLLTAFLRQWRNSRWFSWSELRAMVYLKAWLHVLSRPGSGQNAITLLDHGPLFRLAWLHAFGPELVRSRRFEQWSDSLLSRWAARLDLVVWLDAPDAILVERIEDRNRWHLVKGKPEQEAYRFLARCRASFEYVISKVAAHGGPKVLRFDTERETLDHIVEKVLAACDMDRREC